MNKEYYAEYYVLAAVRISPFKAIAGPFFDREEAEVVASQECHDGWTTPSWDEDLGGWWQSSHQASSEVETLVVEATTMEKRYSLSRREAEAQIFDRDGAI